MSERPQLGWRVHREPWARFVDAVAEKHAEERVYIRIGIENAMLEFLDDDEVLARAEEILKHHTDLRALSSSTESAITTERYQDGDTKLLTHRVRGELKERFSKFADKHDVGYGRLLSVALRAYADGGRAQRILEDVERLVTGATSSGSTDDSVESVDQPLASTSQSLSTATDSATRAGSMPDPTLVIDSADRLMDRLGADGPDGFTNFPQQILDAAIGEVVGDTTPDTLKAYRAPVLDQINAVSHPHRDAFYLSEGAREEMTLWCDLDKSERIVLLRRFAAAEAVDRGKQKCGFDYQDVIELFEDETTAGPSDQYAYDLMDDAADEPGFKYGEFAVGRETPRIQLRVDLTTVDNAILEWVQDEAGQDPSDVGINADVTSYSAGSAPPQEAGADD